MMSAPPIRIYIVATVYGGLLQDVQTFADEAAAQAYLEGIVAASEPEMVEDTGVELALSDTVTETRHTYRTLDGRTHQVAVRSDLTETDHEVYLETSPLLGEAPARPEGSTRLRRVAW